MQDVEITVLACTKNREGWSLKIFNQTFKSINKLVVSAHRACSAYSNPLGLPCPQLGTMQHACVCMCMHMDAQTLL